VDEASYVKASFLAAVASEEASSPLISKKDAVQLLGTMLGGYNVAPLIAALDDKEIAPVAAEALSHTLLMFDAKHDVLQKMEAGNEYAKQVINSWAEAEWFTSKPKVPEKYEQCVFKVTGETNTDDLSPAQDVWSRPDIPLHAKAMFKVPRDGIHDCLSQIEELKEKGFPLVFVGDVVGTGSSRKSATNSILWLMGDDNPYVPNKRFGTICIGQTIAPIFFNTMEDAGALPIEVDDASTMHMGDVVDIFPYEGVIKSHGSDKVLTNFQLKTEAIFDEVQAGGRVPLIIGRGVTSWARETLGLPPSTAFRPTSSPGSAPGYTLAQKMVAKACGLSGVLPGMYVEPKMTTVGSQDSTGPMTRDELKDLACLGFSADLVMQSFCHTAAYPKPVDVVTHVTLPEFMKDRGGVSLRAGDGVIHSWLNRMLLPDTCGTGADSHTRFPIGISFPAGSGAVAFAAATGVMPLDMPESVLVKFTGEMQLGITLRDLVMAIPYAAIQKGLLTVPKQGKKNVFNGRILEIEGLNKLKCEQAFELSDASAERSAAGCTIKLDPEPIIEYLTSNVTMFKWMISEGYGDVRSIERRIAAMEAWMENPVLMEADKEATYHTVLEIDMGSFTEPLLAYPNDPDDVRPLSEAAAAKIDEVFIGSCMTNIGHFRAAGELLKAHGKQLPTRLWIAPPTKMDQAQLTAEGFYSVYGIAGARTEVPGCSLCMGNQARVNDGVTIVSTSTRNFPNRMGKGADCYLASAEVAAIAAILGRLPTKEEYLKMYLDLANKKEQTYRYLNFDQEEAFATPAKAHTLDPSLLEKARETHAQFIA
jgi:aconitate hydratase 2/2-methylisocitrate dehydratase